MKAVKKFRKATRKLMKKLVRHVEEFMLVCLHAAEQMMRTLRTLAPTVPTRPPALGRSDERTWRRIAEAEHGGISSAESAARWERGENRGGTHRRSVRHEGPSHPRPEQDEPQGRKERELLGVKRMAVSRRGS
jgi:hypothetical protein